MKPEVGQTLYSLAIGHAARRNGCEITPVTVMKIGRKYFYAARESWKDSERMWTKYNLSDWREVTEYSANSYLYSSMEEYENDILMKKMREKIDRKIRYGMPLSLTKEQLQSICEILEIEYKD